jgi:hypothetical protein
MSLVQADRPLMTVFAYGETLQPASPDAVFRGLGEFNGMVTNYVVTARYVVKEVIEMSGEPEIPGGGVRAKTLLHNIVYEE